MDAKRMQKHRLEFHSEESSILDPISDESQDDQPRFAPEQAKMDAFTIATSKADKEKFEISLAKAWFACNFPFMSIENKWVKEHYKELRPGYTLPTRQKLSGPLLDAVHEEMTTKACEFLSGAKVTLSVDTWSDVNNSPVLASSFIYKEKVFVVGGLDTTGEPHNAENLLHFVQEQIKQAESKFKVEIVGLVTDNAENMRKMRNDLNADIVSYGCSAHQLNLLGQDIAPPSLIKLISEVSKFFKNVHSARALLVSKNINKPVLPSVVRWNSVFDMMTWFKDNWIGLNCIVTENNNNFSANDNSKNVRKTIKDGAIFNEVSNYIGFLAPVSEAIDKMQSDKATVADGTEIWKNLTEQFRSGAKREWLEKAENRYQKALTGPWFAANLLHPKYMGLNLTPYEIEKALDWVKVKFPLSHGAVFEFIGENRDAIKQKFEGMEGVDPLKFMRSQIALGKLSSKLIDVLMILHVLVPSSAGIERVFSTMGHIHSDKRNRLSAEKTTKLTFINKLLNQNFE